MPLPDPRIHPWREDLAAESLRGLAPAARFVAGVERQVATGIASLKSAPQDTARQGSELRFGERFTVYEEREGWAWGQNQSDGYVGYVRCAALAAPLPPASHRVAALRAFLFPQPDLKEPPRDSLSLTAEVTVVEERAGYAALAGGGWVCRRLLAPPDAVLEPDPVETALRLRGVPYLWGGRSPLGIDCSGLVQLALAAAGIAAPRDSDMQRGETGVLLPDCPADGAGFAFRRGDLVFFPGHVGIMLDATRLIHATAHAMAVVVEPLAQVVTRTEPAAGGGILAVRRLPGYQPPAASQASI